MPGPAPKFDPARKHARTGPLKLPAGGREGRAPKWPLPEAASARERHAWAQAWRTPQAVAWERLGWTRTVARYCQVLMRAEQKDAPPHWLAEARHLEDRLGLTPKSMRVLLWEVVADEVAERRPAAATDDVRNRIKAV